MALTVSSPSGGGASSTTDDTTLVIGPTAAVGDILVIMIAAANTGTSGAARTVTIADNAAGTTNVYTQRGTTGNQTAGVAGDGASQYFFECPITTALTNGVDTITITFSGNVSEKVAASLLLTPAGGETAIFSAVGTASTGAGATTHSAATVSVTSGYTIIAMAAVETDDTITGDSDTTNGNWSVVFGNVADAGNDAASMQLAGQYKTVTATGDQSWACTTSVGRDSARNYIIYYSGTPATGLPRPISAHTVIQVP